ncbi:hypothetical protein F4859DRAFT_514778 [Xylaria cf. heliscus]|nr:hypothetical protein F4859DRAFT_514778 [Xylaria cf. heliscus]
MERLEGHNALTTIPLNADNTEWPLREEVQGNNRQHDRNHNAAANKRNSGYDSLLMFPLSENVHQRKQGLFRSWGWEISACLLSLASFAAIIIVLIIEDGKPLNQWAWSIGPTAVVSFITTIAKSSMLLATAEIIGQLKWHHFHTGTRPVIDLQTFDSAGRGPLGASTLIWKNHVKTSFASLVAVIIILSLLVDPFMQLVFTFPTHSRADSNKMGFFNSTQVYDPLGTPYILNRFGPSSADPKMQLAILAAAGDQPIQVTAACSTGNCTWPSITTLGVCGGCSNVTLQTKVSCPGFTRANIYQCDYSFPSGHNLSGVGFTPGGAGSMQPTRWNSSSNVPMAVVENTPGSVASLTTFRAVQIAAGENVSYVLRRPIAWECDLALCENTYENVESINGRINLPKPRQEALFVGDYHPKTQGSLYWELRTSSNSSTSKYMINPQDYTSLSSYLGELFSWAWIDKGVLFGINTASTTPNLGWQFTESKDFGQTVSNIALSMTDSMRNSRNSTPVATHASETRTYIEVQWGWVALPVGLTVLNTIFVAAMVVKGRQSNVPIWKNSSLALLLYNVAGWAPTTRVLDGSSALNKEAEKISVKMSDNIGDLVFVKK